jgi:transcriptional regulator with XRE-family HTH domain
MGTRTFAMKLKAIRTRRGLTQVELAKKLTVSQAFIAQLETGEQDNPTLATLKRVAKALKCKVSELVE